ncbi:MAG: hypothetical protein HYV63_03330 [Candidatus Schekmanbacteria bacterium]|nr:hypothetical protein [Candidatus Schekmanbacteria bacterium]
MSPRGLAVSCLLLVVAAGFPEMPTAVAADYVFSLSGAYHEPTNARDSYALVYEKGAPRFGLLATRTTPLAGGRLSVRLGYDYLRASGEAVAFGGGGNSWIKAGVRSTLQIHRLLAGLRGDFVRSGTMTGYGVAALGAARVEEGSGGGLSSSSACPAFELAAGGELHATDWLTIGLEAAYSWLPGATGEGGAAQAFGEDDLGGVSVGVVTSVLWRRSDHGLE